VTATPTAALRPARLAFWTALVCPGWTAATVLELFCAETNGDNFAVKIANATSVRIRE
jgi:hypothetical protein